MPSFFFPSSSDLARYRFSVFFALTQSRISIFRSPKLVRALGFLLLGMGVFSLFVPAVAVAMAVAAGGLMAWQVFGVIVPAFLSAVRRKPKPKSVSKSASEPVSETDGPVILPAEILPFHLGDDIKTGRPVRLTAKEAMGNLLISGPSAERTNVCLKIAAGVMASGSGLVYCDGAGDASIYARIYAMARRLGREDDLVVMNCYTSSHRRDEKSLLSNTFNPFVKGSATALVDMVTSLMDDIGSDGAMWKGRSTVMLTGVMNVLVWLRDAKGIPLDIGRVRDCLSLKEIIDMADPDKWPDMPAHVRATVTNYLTSLPGFVRERGVRQANTTLDQHGFMQMQFTRILGSLADVYGHIFLAKEPQIDIEDVVLNRRILIVMLPLLEISADEIANLGKIIVATLKAVPGSIRPREVDVEESSQARNFAEMPSFTVFFGDFEYYTVYGMRLLASVGRDANINFVFGCNNIDALTPSDMLISREVREVTSVVDWRLQINVDQGGPVGILTHNGDTTILRPSSPDGLDVCDSTVIVRANHMI